MEDDGAGVTHPSPDATAPLPGAGTEAAPTASAAQTWHARLTSPTAAAAILLLFYIVLLGSLRDKSATFDEPGHAAAGYVYWALGDFRFDPENGNLSKRWIALPYLSGTYAFPDATAGGWRDSNSLRIADGWFNRMGHDTTAMLFRGRAMSGLVAVALGTLVWLWARRLFGPSGGMIALLAYVCTPALLANGALMTSDIPAAFGLLLSVACIAAVLERITWPRVLAGTLAIAGLFLAKMSAVLIVPVALILAVVRVVDRRPLLLGPWLLERRATRAAALAGIAAVQILGIVFVIWSAYGFRFAAFSPAAPVAGRFQHPWQWALEVPAPARLFSQLDLSPEQAQRISLALQRHPDAERTWTYPLVADVEQLGREVLRPEQSARLARLLDTASPHPIPRAIQFVRDHRLLPEAFTFGFGHVWKTSGQLAAFLNGEIRETGWLHYFPFVFIIKTPITLLALAVLAIAVLARSGAAASPGSRTWLVRWQALQPVLPLLVLFAVYWAAALSSNLNIGHRHLLPIYPPLLILCGATARLFSQSVDSAAAPAPRAGMLKFIVPGLLVGLVVEAAATYPNYLAYFNGLVRPSRAYQHVIDSSLDWGQELPAIARYLEQHPQEPAYLAYFGVGSPHRHGIKARHFGGYPALDWKLAPPLNPLLGRSGPELLAYLRDHPEYDPDLIFNLQGGSSGGVLLTQRASELRLGPGLYVISASMLQPVYHGNVDTFWNAVHEQKYRQLEQIVQPFLSDDRQAKLAAMPARPVADWLTAFEEFYDYRLSRLTAYLRQRPPDDMINHSVLVYRLSQSDLQRALHDPVR